LFNNNKNVKQISLKKARYPKSPKTEKLAKRKPSRNFMFYTFAGKQNSSSILDRISGKKEEHRLIERARKHKLYYYYYDK
jgi:hypothetical protein